MGLDYRTDCWTYKSLAQKRMHDRYSLTQRSDLDLVQGSRPSLRLTDDSALLVSTDEGIVTALRLGPPIAMSSAHTEECAAQLERITKELVKVRLVSPPLYTRSDLFV